MFITSCKEDEESIERKNIDIFNNNKNNLSKSVRYIKIKFLKNFNDICSIKIIPSNKDWIRNNIHYDKKLGIELKDTNVKVISFRKSNKKCQNDLIDIFFEIKPSSEFNYNYVYNFCINSNLKIEENLNYKVIPINNNWNLEIEKN